MNTKEGELAVTDFTGMVSNKDPHDLQPGEATVQVNCLCLRPGELAIRGGLRDMTDDSES